MELSWESNFEEKVEVSSPERLINAIVEITEVIRKYDTTKFNDISYELNGIRASIVWDGTYNELDHKRAVRVLENSLTFLKKCHTVLSQHEFARLQQQFEALEIAITELTLGYID